MFDYRLQLLQRISPALEMGRSFVRIEPFRLRGVHDWDQTAVKTLLKGGDDVSDLVSDLEPDHKGMPVLLRQYLKLGAKLLAFNVDPDFSDVVDGLIIIDLLKTNSRILDNYLTREGRQSFVAFHQKAVI